MLISGVWEKRLANMFILNTFERVFIGFTHGMKHASTLPDVKTLIQFRERICGDKDGSPTNGAHTLKVLSNGT